MRTIVHLSDIHFGKDDPVVADALARDVADVRPSLVVVSGDFTQRARAAQYVRAANYLRRLPSPQLLVPGNHDVPLYDVIRRFFYPLQNFRKYVTPDVCPVYLDEELLVVGLNTARSFTFNLTGFWKDGRISEHQLNDLVRHTRDVPAGVFKVVVTHHPFIPPPGGRTRDVVHGAARALVVMERAGIDLCLAGHLHRSFCGDVRTHHEAVARSILSVQAGTALSTRRRCEPNAYNVLTLNPPGDLTLDVRTWNGDAFDTTNKTHFTRDAQGCWISQS